MKVNWDASGWSPCVPLAKFMNPVLLGIARHVIAMSSIHEGLAPQCFPTDLITLGSRPAGMQASYATLTSECSNSSARLACAAILVCSFNIQCSIFTTGTHRSRAVTYSAGFGLTDMTALVSLVSVYTTCVRIIRKSLRAASVWYHRVATPHLGSGRVSR